MAWLGCAACGQTGRPGVDVEGVGKEMYFKLFSFLLFPSAYFFFTWYICASIMDHNTDRLFSIVYF